jgi:hypothetical protein
MNNYMMFKQKLVVSAVPVERIHPEMWKGANKKFRPFPFRDVAREIHNAPRTLDQQVCSAFLLSVHILRRVLSRDIHPSWKFLLLYFLQKKRGGGGEERMTAPKANLPPQKYTKQQQQQQQQQQQKKQSS